jgi:hypothetical protein
MPSAGAMAALAQLNAGRVLRPLVNLFTAVAFYFHLRQFLSTTFVLRYDPNIAYIALLTAYAGHRELRRWVADPEIISERARRGELFVVFWWAFYIVALTAANHIASCRVPEGLLSLCMQITAIFFGTLTSQQFFKRKTVSAMSAVDKVSLQERILKTLGEAQSPMSTGDLALALGASKATVWRAVKGLEDQSKVEWSGRSDSDPDGGIRLKK